MGMGNTKAVRVDGITRARNGQGSAVLRAKGTEHMLYVSAARRSAHQAGFPGTLCEGARKLGEITRLRQDEFKLI